MRRTLSFVIALCALTVVVSACDTNRPSQAQGTGGTAAKSAADTSGANYDLTLSGETVTVGEPSKLGVKVVPKPGFKVNLEFPWRASVKAAEGMEVPAEELQGDKWKLTKSEAVLEVPVKAAAAGNTDVVAKLNFSVCNDERCDVIRDHEITWKVAAK